MAHGVDGLPILPTVKERTLPQIKQIVRSFLTLTYRLSTFTNLLVMLCSHLRHEI